MTRWYCAIIGLFLAVRAVTTLTAGASFGMPGDGWRSIFQLISAALLAWGISRPISRARRPFVATVLVGSTYAAATVLELVHGNDLVGLIPVDHRDRFVHPLIALLALVSLLTARRPRSTPASQRVTQSSGTT